MSASLLKQFVKFKLSSKETINEEKGAVLEEIFLLIFNEAVEFNIKEILGDSIKLVLIKCVSRPLILQDSNSESTLRNQLVNKVFEKISGVSKRAYIGGLICIEAVTRTLQNVISVGEFYRMYSPQLSELGVRLFNSLEPEFRARTELSSADYTELYLR